MPKFSKIADIVSSQLPNFVQDDYPTFIAFLEAYYTFLDQQKMTRNLEYIKDVDSTLDDFIGYIRREIAPEIPQNNRFFMNHAKEAQLARGSEDSYRSLFRLLLKKEIDIQYPAEKMLRASGGEWEQDTSFFMKVTAGDPFTLQNNYLYINCVKRQTAHKHRVYVKKIQKVETTLDIYEVFITKNYYGIIDHDDEINYNGVKAVIQPTTAKVKIVKAGNGFKAGQVFNIGTSTASGLQVKVVKTTPDGGLKQLQIISFGVGFKKDFYYNLTRYQALASSQAISGLNISVNDVLTDGNDAGVLNKVNYHSNYAEGNYVGDVLADFYSTNIPEESEQVVASILVELGGISRYPGYYKSSNSLIDDDSFIQDGEYYQDFSYVIKIDEKLDTYRDTVLSILHPVGRKLFGEYQLDSSFQLDLEISNPVIRILIPQFSESVEAVSMLDRTIYGVENFRFVANGVLDSWQIYDPENPVASVILFVKLNGVSLDRVQYWDIVGDNVVFNFVPTSGDIIEVRYAVMSYSGSTSLQTAIFDVRKPLSDIASSMEDVVSTKAFSKSLLPAYGYIDEVTQTDVRVNLTTKVFPSLEILQDPQSTNNQKDYFVMGDTGTAEGAAPETNLTIKGISKALTSASVTPLSDAAVFSMSKPLTDTQSLIDSSVNLFTKILNPSTGYTDQVKMTNGTGATESDSTDTNTKFVVKPLTDSINSAAFTHTVGFTLSKPLTDSINSAAFTHTVGFTLSKPLTDSINSAAFTHTVGFTLYKPLSDSISDFTDASTKVFNKYLADSVTIAENIGSVLLIRNLSDSAIVGDYANKTMNSGAVTETASATDSSTSTFMKSLTETVTINSTGYLQLNPYSSDLTFFAEEFLAGRTDITI